MRELSRLGGLVLCVGVAAGCAASSETKAPPSASQPAARAATEYEKGGGGARMFGFASSAGQPAVITVRGQLTADGRPLIAKPKEPQSP